MARNTSGKDNTDASRRWAALDSKNERLADSAELLHFDLNRDRTSASQPSAATQQLRAAS